MGVLVLNIQKNGNCWGGNVF